jgi:hypothetical protein
MNKKLVPAVAALAILPVVSSCTTFRSGAPVKAVFDAPAKSGGPTGVSADEEGWASRYIPGVRAISRIVPQPSESRVKWDEWYKKRNDRWGTETMNATP